MCFVTWWYPRPCQGYYVTHGTCSYYLHKIPKRLYSKTYLAPRVSHKGLSTCIESCHVPQKSKLYLLTQNISTLQLLTWQEKLTERTKCYQFKDVLNSLKTKKIMFHMPPLSDNNLRTVTFQLCNMSSSYQNKCTDQTDPKKNQLIYRV